MSGTVTFGGLGSGLDTESIVNGLVNASRGPITQLKQRVTDSQSAVSVLSDISTLLGKLKTAAGALATSDGVSSYKVASSGAAVAISSTGQAKPGSFDVIVDKLAKEQRTYSNGFAMNTALGQTGTLGIQIGTGATTNINIAATDSLDNIASKINASGARVSASVLYDGVGEYKLQIRGLDTGGANALTFNEGGVNLGVDVPANTYQAAQDSQIRVDGMTIRRATNQVSGVVAGVTMALTAESASAVKVTIDTDPKGLGDKVKAFVDSYNSVVSKVQQTSGYGSLKPQVQELAGNSTLRNLSSRLSTTTTQVVTGATNYTTLGSIGISRTRDGKMSLDSAKFEKAMVQDQSAVEKVLSGTTGGSDGIMDLMSKTVDAFAQSNTGLLSQTQEAYKKKITDLTSRADREETRLARYAEQLRKQFTQMDSVVGANKVQQDYLSRYRF